MAHSKPTSEKLSEAAPYNILYNSIPGLPRSQNSNTVTFTDFLCPSLGKLKSSVQIASKVDFEWLIQQYEAMDVGDTPLTVLYGEDLTRDGHDLGDETHVIKRCFNEKVKSKFRDPHHEIGLYLYHDNSIRIVISTANLYDTQWDCFIHGFWVSPKCPRLSDSSPGESPTNFKSDFLNFFALYNLPDWYDHLKQTDFSALNVFLVTSTPGSHPPNHPASHHQQVQNILKKHREIPSSWPLIAQASNMGQFGETPDVWLRSFFVKGLMELGERLNIIFPTLKQVKNGALDEEIVQKGLIYNRHVHNRQRWLEEYLYEWRANNSERSKFMPHTKTYYRVSPCYSKMAWFLLTSSNINKGAWGQEYCSKEGEKNGNIYVRNYEVGVMFLPEFFGKDYFEVAKFPLIIDMPPKRYSKRDHPWSVRCYSTTHK